LIRWGITLPNKFCSLDELFPCMHAGIMFFVDFLLLVEMVCRVFRFLPSYSCAILNRVGETRRYIYCEGGSPKSVPHYQNLERLLGSACLLY